MGLALSKPADGRKDKKKPTWEQELSRRGVLIPPSFGTGLDFVHPPSSSFSSAPPPLASPPSSVDGAVRAEAGAVRSSVAHLLVSTRSLSGSGVVSKLAHADDPASRLLGTEHLRPGVWLSASTSDFGGNATAGGCSSAGGGGGSASWEGYLSGALVAALSGRDANAIAGAGATLSTATTTSRTEGGGGGVVDRYSPASESLSSFGGSASVFASRTLPGWCGGGVLSACASISDSDTSSAPRREASAPASAAASISESVRSFVSGGGSSIPVGEGGEPLSASGFAGRVGWNYATSFEVVDPEEGDWGGGSGESYYRNNPFANGKGSKKDSKPLPSVGVGVGYSAHFTEPHPDAPPEARSPLRAGKYDMTALSSHASVDAPSFGTRAAIEGTLPVSALAELDLRQDAEALSSPSSFLGAVKGLNPAVSYYASFDLNRFASADTPDGDDDGNVGPPIVVTLHKTDRGGGNKAYSTESAATISQTVTFDRLVANPLEDRCPRIRNTVSWAVRMSRIASAASASTPPGGIFGGGGGGGNSAGSTDARTCLSAAAAWQVNRGLAYKVRLDAQEGWAFGVLLKRWAHPRVTASILFGAPLGVAARPGTGRVEFRGVGVQVETGPLPGGRRRRGGRPDRAGIAARAGPDGRVGFDTADIVYGAAGAGVWRGKDGGPPATRAELVED